MKLRPRLPTTRVASALPRRLPAIVASLAMGLAAIWVAAYWLSKIVAPRPVANLPDTRQVERAVGSDLALRVFAASGAAQPGTVPANIVLTGVFAGQDGRGFATFRLPQGAKGALVGQEVVPGVTLARAEKERVVLRASGVEHNLALVKERPTVAANASPANTATPNNAVPTASRDH